MAAQCTLESSMSNCFFDPSQTNSTRNSTMKTANPMSLPRVSRSLRRGNRLRSQPARSCTLPVGHIQPQKNRPKIRVSMRVSSQ